MSISKLLLKWQLTMKSKGIKAGTQLWLASVQIVKLRTAAP